MEALPQAVTNSQPTPRNIQEQRRPPLYSNGSLKPYMIKDAMNSGLNVKHLWPPFTYRLNKTKKQLEEPTDCWDPYRTHSAYRPGASHRSVNKQHTSTTNERTNERTNVLPSSGNRRALSQLTQGYRLRYSNRRRLLRYELQKQVTACCNPQSGHMTTGAIGRQSRGPENSKNAMITTMWKPSKRKKFCFKTNFFNWCKAYTIHKGATGGWKGNYVITRIFG